MNALLTLTSAALFGVFGAQQALDPTERARLATLDSTSAHLANALKLDGVPVEGRMIPRREIRAAAKLVEAIVSKDTLVPAVARRWVGRRNSSATDEPLFFRWETNQTEWTWIDVGAKRGLLVARGQDARETTANSRPLGLAIVEWAQEHLRYPATLPAPLKFYVHSSQEIGGQEYVSGYVSFSDDQQAKIYLARENEWIRSVAVWIGPDWICAQIPFPFSPSGEAPGATGIRLPKGMSRFDPPESDREGLVARVY